MELNERIRRVKKGRKNTNYIGNDTRTLEALFDIHNRGYVIIINEGRMVAMRKERSNAERPLRVFHESDSNTKIKIREVTKEAIWEIWLAVKGQEN